MSSPGRLFRFVQLEIPWQLGPADGRYLLRATAADAGPADAGAPSHVLVLTALGAPERRRLVARRRPPAVDPEPPPTPVATTRATLIDVGSPLADSAAGGAWLAAAGEQEVRDALTILNRVLHAHRLATSDAQVHPVARDHVIAARVGIGEGERVADGRWAQAREVPPSSGRRRRRAVLEPQARLAALLGGHERELVTEELALRAREDLDAGRPRHAALGLLVTLDAAIAELQADPHAEELAPRVDELRDRREAVGAAAQTALGGPLDDEHREAVAEALARVEAALRARAAAAA